MPTVSRGATKPRILLLGDFSGMHSHLAAGLRYLGYSVTVASSGDGWKRLPTDMYIGSDEPGLWRKVERNLRPFFMIGALSKFEIVQLQNPIVFPWRLGVNDWAIKRIAKNVKQLFLVAAGDDAYFWRKARARLSYGPFDDFLVYDLKKPQSSWESDRLWRWNQEVVRLADAVIPVCYEYWLGYEGCANATAPIPLPLDCQAIPFSENIVKGKVRIAHGLSREGFKGTRFIRSALDKISAKYPRDIEITYLERLPYKEYLGALRQSNVVIDQALSHSWGMNALIAMASGRVVLGGAEPPALTALGVSLVPIINIRPSEQSVYCAIERLLADKTQVSQIGIDSRRFVEDTHDCKRVARMYIQVWQDKLARSSAESISDQ